MSGNVCELELCAYITNGVDTVWCARVRMYIYIYMCVCMCMCVHVCVCVCVCMCMRVYEICIKLYVLYVCVQHVLLLS